MMKHAFACLTILFLASPAAAATIDFTDASFSGATGQTTFSQNVGGLGVTVEASVDIDPAPEDPATLKYSSAGLGVNFDDGFGASRQIEGEEILTVTFDDLVVVSELSVSNLFDWGCLQIEVGSYTINGDSFEFEAENWNGRLTVPVDALATNTIVFRAVGDWSGWQDNGFTLSSLTLASPGGIVAVPELDPSATPAAVAVVAGGALVLNGRRRARA